MTTGQRRLERWSRAAAASLMLIAGAASAQELPRKAVLGVALAPAPEGTSGVQVQQVMPKLTGEALGLSPGDVIVRIGSQPVTAVSQVTDYASRLRAGDSVDITVRRKGAERRIRGRATPQPFETYRKAKVDYGAVRFRDGHLRDILVTPAGVKEPPVLYLLPGFSCISIEPRSASHPYAQLGANIVAQGIAYYRVEKPGMGDSTGTTRCTDIDYATELDAFRAGYRHLLDVRGVKPERIFMFGHSLGGLQAPMLAAELPPRGIAVFGTVYRNWGDHHRDVAAFQSFLMAGEDPVSSSQRLEAIRPLLERFYFAKQSPKQIAADVPKAGDELREFIAWDGGERAMGRHFKYMQDLAGLPLAQAWRDSKTNVLSLYGEADLVALFDEDHRLIADVANHYRPGTGRYVEVARTDHGMTLVGSRDEFRRAGRAASGQPPEGEFNPEVAKLVGSWIREAMARPPVASAGASPAG